jgi:hypothetical protein
MADVSPRLRGADRAQLFLIGALALSVIFVVLAVLLNTAIYTGNIATRNPGPGTTEVVEYERAALSMADTTITTVNGRNNSSYSELRSAFGDTVVTWSDLANTHSGVGLADSQLSVVTTRRGSKVGQEQARNFTSDTGAGNWTVVNNSSTRAFRMNVSQPSLLNTTLAGQLLNDSFYVGFDDGGGEWRTYIYREGTGNVTVKVTDPSGSQVGDSCSVDSGSDDYVHVNISTAELGGAACPASGQLFAGLDQRYNVTYGNALGATDSERINGTYSVVVDRPVGQFETGADENATEPYAAPALYSADLQITYRSSRVYYRTNVRVAPEEPDE